MGQHRMDGIHLICQYLIQNMKEKHIPLLELLQIGKHLLGRHTAVARDDGMGTLSTNRQRRTHQMPGSSVQRIASRSMVDGQVNADCGNLHIPHDPGTAQIQLINIILRCHLNGFLGVGFLRCPRGNCPVIGNGTFPDTLQF